MQIIANGGFNVTCTQGSESAHKLFMKLASLRVRHLRSNTTYSSMMRYMNEYILFEAVRRCHFDCDRDEVTKTHKRKAKVSAPLYKYVSTQKLTMGTNLEQISSQRCFIHPQVRVCIILYNAESPSHTMVQYLYLQCLATVI